MTKNIAIIDDDDIYQYSVKRTLLATKLASNIISFTDGQDAIDFFIENVSNEATLPDIVFLDLNMPIVDGWQFLERYEEIKDKVPKDIAIYITSSSKNPDDLMQAKNLSTVRDYLVKPTTFEEFKAVLES